MYTCGRRGGNVLYIVECLGTSMATIGWMFVDACPQNTYVET